VTKNESCLVHVDDLLHDVLDEQIGRLDARVDGRVAEELTGHVDRLVINVRQQVLHTILLYFFYITTSSLSNQ